MIDRRKMSSMQNRRTDFEMEEFCAKAMGIRYKVGFVGSTRFVQILNYPTDENGGEYCPLHDKAQAMEIVEKFYLCIQPPLAGESNTEWHVWFFDKPNHTGIAESLNRAIVECVAKMESSK